jgi:mono/diheme cytochrome c family protein
MRLTASLVAILTAYTFAFSASALHAQVSRSVWDGVYNSDQEKRGAGLYTQHCAVCHAETLEGSDEVPPLAGAQFLSNWTGLTVGDLFERIRTTMPINKPQSLSREVISAILAHILSVNKFPAGKEDLSGQSEVLKEIRIDAPKPN